MVKFPAVARFRSCSGKGCKTPDRVNIELTRADTAIWRKVEDPERADGQAFYIMYCFYYDIKR
jgi:hypothetical protein